MSTESETGWSREMPSVNGVYWWRWPQNGQQIVYEVYGEKVFLGMQEQHPPKDGEWLGPITPADAEQLVALREAAKDAAEWIDNILFGRPLTKQGDTVIAALRNALGTQREEETNARFGLY